MFDVLLNNHRHRGGDGVAIPVTVVAIGSSDPLGISEMSTVTNVAGVGVTIPLTVPLIFWEFPRKASTVAGTAGSGARSS